MAAGNHGGLQIVLPDSVPEDISSEFGRQCQSLDEGMQNLQSTAKRRALLIAVMAHIRIQLTVIDLAQELMIST